jgi:hypothetical protein
MYRRKKKNMMKEKKIGKGRSWFKSSALIVALVCGILVAYATFPQPVLKVDEKGWHILFEGNLAQAVEGDPGAGQSGILEIFFINHSAGNDYKAVNDSSTLEGWCDAANLGYANNDAFNVELAHSVLFDIAIKVRVNATEGKDGANYNDAYIRMNITSTDLGIVPALSPMDKNVLTNDTGDSYIWLMFYYDFGGAGYDLSKDQTADIDALVLSAYY